MVAVSAPERRGGANEMAVSVTGGGQEAGAGDPAESVGVAGLARCRAGDDAGVIPAVESAQRVRR
jgi:hypothetical protein